MNIKQIDKNLKSNLKNKISIDKTSVIKYLMLGLGALVIANVSFVNYATENTIQGGIVLGDVTSTAIGKDAIATGRGTTSIGANTFASGNNMTREQYEEFIRQNNEKLKEIERKMQEALIERQDLTNLENEYREIANKLKAIETYRTQIAEKERLLNEKEPVLTREIEVKKGEKVSYRTQIEDLERRLNIINSLDFDSLDQNHLDEGITRLAQGLKTKMEQGATFLGEYGANGLPLSQYEASIRAIIATQKYKNKISEYDSKFKDFDSSEKMPIDDYDAEYNKKKKNDRLNGDFVLVDGELKMLDVNERERLKKIIQLLENTINENPYMSKEEREKLRQKLFTQLEKNNVFLSNEDKEIFDDKNYKRVILNSNNKYKTVLSEEDAKKIGNGILIFRGKENRGDRPLLRNPENEDEERDWAVVGYINELFGNKYTKTTLYSYDVLSEMYYNNRVLGNDTMLRTNVINLYKGIQESFNHILTNEELTERNKLNTIKNENLSDVEILKKISLNKKYDINEKRIFDENTTIEKYNKWKELIDMPLNYEMFLNIIKDVKTHSNGNFSEELTYKTMFSDTFREMRYNYLKSTDINYFVEKQKGLKAREDAVKLIKVFDDEITRLKALEKDTQEQITVRENEIAGYRNDITNLTNLLNGENPGNADEVVRQINEKKELIANKEKEIANLKSQIVNVSDGENALAHGTNSVATGRASISLGTRNYTNKDYSIAIGTKNTVVGEKSIAIGYGHKVIGDRNATLGDPNNIYGDDNFVVGNNVNVGTVGEKANNNLVLGSNVTINGGVHDAIVIGNGSQVISGAVSVGSTGAERQIKNVKDATDNQDAVTYKQLKDYVAHNASTGLDLGDITINNNSNNLIQGLSNTSLKNIDTNDPKWKTNAATQGQLVEVHTTLNDRINLVDSKVNLYDNRINENSKRIDIIEKNDKVGTATAIAMANAPTLITDDKKFAISIGSGVYGGEHAHAIAFNGKNEEGNFVYKVTAGLNSNSKFALGLGVGYQFGKTNVAKEKEQLKAMVNMQSNEINNLKEEIEILKKAILNK